MDETVRDSAVAASAGVPAPLNIDGVSGHDPFDALAGKRVPAWAKGGPRRRQALVQLRKRCPVDLSGPLAIAPFTMAKTVACRVTAASRILAVGDTTPAAVRDLVESLLACEGNLGGGRWGYEFDVQTRWAYYPSGTPNLIATAFAAHALTTAGLALHAPDLLAAAASAARFVREDLVNPDSLHYRYVAHEERLVHNANLLGAAAVAEGGLLAGDREALGSALVCASTSAAAQRADGSWPYGESRRLGWSDNFHTAYDLDGLLRIWLATGDARVRRTLDLGITHWARDFFGGDGAPKYYPNRLYPYDIHSAGTGIDLAARLASWGWDTGALAERVAAWTERNLVDRVTGGTYYRRHRLWTDRRHFVRWGDAHLAMGRASLALMRRGARDPLEVEIARLSGVNPDAR